MYLKFERPLLKPFTPPCLYKQQGNLLIFKLIFLLGFMFVSCKKQAVGPSPAPPVIVPQKLSIANVLQSNMVIQRDKPVNIWGQVAPGVKVSATVSWDNNIYIATANSSGNWLVTIPATPQNTKPQTVTVNSPGSDAIVLNNILIGDVWICSGQSNMVMPVAPAYNPFRGVTNYQAEIDASDYPLIREGTIYDNFQPAPINNIADPVKWQAYSPATTGSMSAVPYFFARKLYTTLNVPVGIIVAATNGSYCEAWTPSKSLQADSYLNNIYSGANKSSMLYNGMINPLSQLAIKGFIWYQGESNNTNDPAAYAKLNTALINGWRDAFNQGLLPFYYVQLAPFDVTGLGNADDNSLAKFREGQASIRTATTQSGMAVTMDVGEPENLHPQNKEPVGERLALLALNNTYALGVQSVGPQYLSFNSNNFTVTINFNGNTASGLNTVSGAAINQYFYLAGTDHIFRLGSAVINNDKIVVTAPADTPLPIQAVRYAFTNFPVTNLQNGAGLPMEPFRSDSWSN